MAGIFGTSKCTCIFLWISLSQYLVITAAVSKLTKPPPIFGGDTGVVFETKCKIMVGKVNQLYERSVKKQEAMTFTFLVDKKYYQDSYNTALRFEAEAARNATLLDPLLFSIGQRKSITTFELPQTFNPSGSFVTNGPVYYTAGGNLCMQRNDNTVAEDRNITVRVSTSSIKAINFKLILLLTRNFQIPMGQELTLDVSPTSPRYMGFQFSRPDVSLVKIRAYSESSSCMTISVQTSTCPIFDREVNVRYQGLWQTMTTTSAMTLERRNRFENGFTVVLVAHDNDDKCSKTSPYIDPFDDSGLVPDIWNSTSGKLFRRNPRTKTVRLIITNESNVSWWIYFLCMFIPVISTFLLITVVTALYHNRHSWLKIECEDKFSGSHSGLISSIRSPSNRYHFQPPALETNDEHVLHDLGILPSPEEEHPLQPLGTIPPPDSAVSSPIEQFYKKQNRTGGSSSNWKAELYLADFFQKDPSHANKSGRRFYWTIIIIAIFYCIPVYQLILHYLRVLYRTGEYDICYYNYLCAHRLGLMVDFNHFWSNISYIIFGFAFVYLVSRRANSYVKPVASISKGKKGCCYCWEYSKVATVKEFGVPQHWGIYYALGIALALEGVLSAAYHLCPNQSSFQFDTCFMYVISVLILLKIYQFRHSVHLGANHTFAILAAFLLISVVGLMFEYENTTAKVIYRWTFISFQFISIIIFSVYFYSFGYIKNADGSIMTSTKLLLHLDQLKGQRFHGDKLLYPLILLLLGVVVLVYSELGDKDFATYLLYTLVAYVIGSTAYYVGIMKPLHGEFQNRTWVQPCVYFLGAGIIGGFAMTFFIQSPAGWELSAADSRAGNEECLQGWFPFHPFYDSHDVWHFLSSAALFLSFMGLLIVDDDLKTKHQSQIPVF